MTKSKKLSAEQTKKLLSYYKKDLRKIANVIKVFFGLAYKLNWKPIMKNYGV